VLLFLPPVITPTENHPGDGIGSAGKGLGDTVSGVTKGVGDTTSAAGDTVKSGTDSIGGKKQDAQNPLGL
jgi:hypothetical protein